MGDVLVYSVADSVASSLSFLRQNESLELYKKETLCYRKWRMCGKERNIDIFDESQQCDCGLVNDRSVENGD